MRLMLTAMTCPKGEFAVNLGRHRALLRDGGQAGCDLVLLPEMSLTGYRPGAAISLEHPAVADLVSATSGAPALCFGLAEAAPPGRPYITQVVAAAGQLLAVHRKAHLGEGEDADFQPGTSAGVFEVAGVTCAVAVCAEIGTETPHRLGAELMLGPAAPGLYGERRVADADWQRGFTWWRDSVVDDARRLLGPGQRLAVSTQAGATNDEDFPGWAGLLSEGGEVVAELPDWREASLLASVACRP